jgi:hypothetical protein
MVFILCIFLHSIFQTNKMHYLRYNKTDHKTHVILDVNFYMFWHQGAIIREFIDSMGLYVQHIFQALVAVTFIIKISLKKLKFYITC